MSVSHEDVFAFAKQLSDGDSEIEWRDSAARAYYAAFHRAKLSAEYCPDNSHLSMGSHERVTDRFERHNTQQARSISYVLKSMKKIRIAADYEISGAFIQSAAQAQVATYIPLVQRLDDFDRLSMAKSA